MRTFTPECTKEVTHDLNVALETVNGIYPLIPSVRICELINAYNLSAENLVGQLHGDNGHMSVRVSQDIFFVMSWYRFVETGRFEIVAYATSNYDDYHTPFAAVYKSAEKTKRKHTLNQSLGNLPQYFNGKGHAFACIEAAIKDAGFDYYDFQDATSGMFVGGAQGTISVSVSNNVFVTVSWYKMESGRYEIVSYAS